MSAYYTPSVEEGAIFTYLFQQATNGAPTQRLGGADAVQFFVKSGLPIATLKTVWTLGSNGQKEMTQREFNTAMRLIALAQNGHAISDATLDSTIGVKVPAPKFSGVDLPQQTQTQSQQQAVSYQVAPDARAQYEKLWGTLEKNELGMVEGRIAAPFFAKSGLDRDVLRNLWKLSDLTADGVMDFKEFCLCMHMILLAKKNGGVALESIPAELMQSVSEFAQSSTSTAPPPPAAIGLNASAFVNTSATNFSLLEEPQTMASQSPASVLSPMPMLATTKQQSSASSFSSTIQQEEEEQQQTMIAAQLNQGKRQMDEASALVNEQITRAQSDKDRLGKDKAKLNAALKEANAKQEQDARTLAELDALIASLQQALRDAAQAAAEEQAAKTSSNDASLKRRAAPAVPATRPTSGSFMPAPPQQPPPPPPSADAFDVFASNDNNNPFGQ